MPDPDHRFMVPPFLFKTTSHTTPSGDQLYGYQLRVGQPNVSYLDPATAHSIEHFLIINLPKKNRAVTQVGVMGCMTGFTIGTIGLDFDVLSDLVAEVLDEATHAKSVPVADVIHCGRADGHNLVGAQRVAAWLLHHRSEWDDPGTDKIAH